MITAKVIVMVGTEIAQYVEDRREFATQPDARQADEFGYDFEVYSERAKTRVWVPFQGVWQMKPTYGSLARHFSHTRFPGLNCAPNESSNPSDHRS
jgi:hypothetical protein